MAEIIKKKSAEISYNNLLKYFKNIGHPNSPMLGVSQIRVSSKLLKLPSRKMLKLDQKLKINQTIF